MVYFGVEAAVINRADKAVEAGEDTSFPGTLAELLDNVIPGYSDELEDRNVEVRAVKTTGIPARMKKEGGAIYLDVNPGLLQQVLQSSPDMARAILDHELHHIQFAKSGKFLYAFIRALPLIGKHIEEVVVSFAEFRAALFQKLLRRGFVKAGSLLPIDKFVNSIAIEEVVADLVRNKNFNIVFVMGHENPDADTFVSSITEAYLEMSKDKGRTIYIPVVRAESGDLSNEIVSIARRMHIDTQKLLMYSQLTATLEALLPVDEKEKQELRDRLSIILVDTNKPPQAGALVGTRVRKIIDHHPNKDSVKMGSAATLIARDYLANSVRITYKTAVLLLWAIISDTLFFFSPTTTATDVKIVRYLASLANVNLRELFGDLTASYDSSLMTPEDMLTDMKRDYHTGIAVGQSFITSFKDAEKNREGVMNLMRRRLYEEGLKSILLMVTEINNKNAFHTKLWVVSEDDTLSLGMMKTLKKEERTRKAYDKYRLRTGQAVEENGKITCRGRGFWEMELPGLVSRKSEIVEPLKPVWSIYWPDGAASQPMVKKSWLGQKITQFVAGVVGSFGEEKAYETVFPGEIPLAELEERTQFGFGLRVVLYEQLYQLCAMAKVDADAFITRSAADVEMLVADLSRASGRYFVSHEHQPYDFKKFKNDALQYYELFLLEHRDELSLGKKAPLFQVTERFNEAIDELVVSPRYQRVKEIDVNYEFLGFETFSPETVTLKAKDLSHLDARSGEAGIATVTLPYASSAMFADGRYRVTDRERPAPMRRRVQQRIIESIWQENIEGHFLGDINIAHYAARYRHFGIYYLIRDIMANFVADWIWSPRLLSASINSVAQQHLFSPVGLSTKRFFVLKELMTRLHEQGTLKQYGTEEKFYDFVELYRAELAKFKTAQSRKLDRFHVSQLVDTLKTPEKLAEIEKNVRAVLAREGGFEF